MNRPFIFLSGEFRITMPLVFKQGHERWQHCMESRILELNSDGSFRRKGHNDTERLFGVVYHAGVEDEFLRRQNLQFFIDNNIPCYPDPKKLLAYDDRHIVMRKCINAGLVSHSVIQGEWDGINIHLPPPFVVKTGNTHRGQDKYLCNQYSDLPKWEGIATIEPFFVGTSCRVLWIEDKWFQLKFENDNSWIKNAAGAELSLFPNMPMAVVEHSRKVKELFELDVCGIDYIVDEKSGEFWFLEYNQFPGQDIDDEATPIINDFWTRKMALVEKQSSKKLLDDLTQLSQGMGLYD